MGIRRQAVSLRVFSRHSRKVSFANLPVTPNALPESFLSDLLALEKWPPATTLLATPNNTISWPDNSSLRMWLPDVDSNFSPHHSITVCCGRTGDRARSHGPSLGYRDIHQESANRQGAVWNSYFSHVLQCESLASVFYSTMEYWVGYTAEAIPRSTIEPILTSYKELCSQYQAGLHAWRLPPHTLAYNPYTLIFSLYALDSLLLEDFGAGAYSAAVAALLAYRPPSRAEYSNFDCVLTCLGGIAMPPKIFQEFLDVYYKAHSQKLELANDSAAKGHVYDESSFTHSLRIVLHVHDRIFMEPQCSKELTEDEVALLQAIRPLLTNPDCHFLAVLTALVQSILEGRTDCPISGVFGAGKTRAAAAMIAGLLVMDPTLKVMVVTKENAAAHAFAKHIESLQLPPSLEEKFGRLVGATELEKGPASQSKLDILPGSRNTVLRTKQVIIGCGGGFHQECTQPYSPVARWMSEVDIALN